ncbi:hypothetical protein BOTBODRAFT_55555 [Botryobasidium botryosum FD-172 SS1]|uniref:Uncharacterized protein n=1 Tax=Botryobasidium botryosum (strain FD-172 SS1) TaxID=930990 RepID=A0A067MH89_BOTB1|nr:hypothetical protein BOTBODRAFT_55555 [Botryobasidium botryosum FD-172 SS1]
MRLPTPHSPRFPARSLPIHPVMSYSSLPFEPAKSTPLTPAPSTLDQQPLLRASSHVDPLSSGTSAQSLS